MFSNDRKSKYFGYCFFNSLTARNRSSLAILSSRAISRFFSISNFSAAILSVALLFTEAHCAVVSVKPLKFEFNKTTPLTKALIPTANAPNGFAAITAVKPVKAAVKPGTTVVIKKPKDTNKGPKAAAKEATTTTIFLVESSSPLKTPTTSFIFPLIDSINGKKTSENVFPKSINEFCILFIATL